MHPMSPAVAMMLADIQAAARRSDRVPVDPAELERYTYRAMSELARLRPRITDYLPELALNRVMALIDRHQRPGRTRLASHSLGRLEAAAASSDICRSRWQDCRSVSAAETGQRVCRCSGRTPAASAWFARLPWKTSTAREAQMPV